MTINPVQSNIYIDKQPSYNKKKVTKSYLEAQGAVSTKENVKPLPPQGHLIHDNLNNSIKYFFKDIAYDMKSVKNGFNGSAKDHQLGRHNDIGLVTAGVLIATYLASKTTDPKARLMEYIGLGAFLTAMSIYPKIAINTPAKLMHGYDIDKEFIDDQGRKKSVMQDSNYVPYDMYLGEIPEEDIELIGDKMGIPRDIVNRNDVIKEQMRKIATQNNTLWMLTAGFATPVLAALLCCGIENYIAGPAATSYKNLRANSQIAKLLEKTSNMDINPDSIKTNSLSNKVEKLLLDYKNKELPKEEFNNLLKILTEKMDANVTEGIKEDLSLLFKASAGKGCESVVITPSTVDEMLVVAKNTLPKQNFETLEKLLVPTKEELEAIIKSVTSSSENELSKGITTSFDNVSKLKDALKRSIDTKIETSQGIPVEFLNAQRNDIISNISKTIKAQKSSYVDEESIKKVTNLAKILGEFKQNHLVLDKCKSIKVEHAPGTIIARYYDKFEKTLLDELGIKFKDLKKMRENEIFTKNLLDKKMIDLCKDDNKYQKAMEKLGKIISDMEAHLNSEHDTKSRLLDLINATENNYNKTAQRISKIGSFKNTINRLVKEDIGTLGNSISTRQELFDVLDGIVENKFANLPEWWKLDKETALNYLKENSKGIGSSKNQDITRIIERYQGSKNSFYRVLHTLEVHKRSLNPEQFAEALYGKDSAYRDSVIKQVKDTLLSATASEHNLKLNTVNNPTLYKDIFYSGWAAEAGEFFSTKQKGYVTETAKNALNKHNNLAKGNVLDRYQYYITRFRNLAGNSTIDFTKPEHILHTTVNKNYTQAERTRMSFFNLIGQSPVEMIKGAAKRRYSTQKWVRIISTITASVFGVAFLAQFGFGKLNNPQNLKKQVNNDTNK